MKKKGLIISTIVMVVVLIASLTTATYAWFNNSGSAKVSDVTFSVSSASDVKIGVSATNQYKATPGFEDFYSESTTYTAYADGKRTGTFGSDNYGTWDGSNNDLGLNVTLPFSTWQPSKAVFSATARTLSVAANPDAEPPVSAVEGAATLTTSGEPAATSFDPLAGYMIKANGTNSTLDNSTIEDAIMNTDFLHIAFGAVAGTTNVRSFGVWIYVDRTDTKTSVGILSGLHVCYRVNGGAWTDVDLYGSYHQDTRTSTMDAPTKPFLTYDSGTTKYTYKTDIVPAAGDAALWVELAKSADASSYVGQEAANIVQFEMVMYLDGTDSDTITTALKNNSAKISVLFLAVNGTQNADA